MSMLRPDWTGELMNPQAIRSLYDQAPFLGSVSLLAWSFDREGPCCTVRFAIDRFPERPPTRWRPDNGRAAIIELMFFPVESFQCSGGSTENRGSITIERDMESGARSFVFRGDQCHLMIRAGFIRASSVMPCY